MITIIRIKAEKSVAQAGKHLHLWLRGRYELPYFSSKEVKDKGGVHKHLEAQVVKLVHGDEKYSANCTKEKRENPRGIAVPVKNNDAENGKKADSSHIDKVQKKADINEPKNPSGKQSASKRLKLSENSNNDGRN
ncbi:hypothetical protein GOBAR_DD16190 [Gossypium barbadense]|nr:hypothetical protein GOBAR_DD16190 [Gossypium barbadense]